MHQKIDWQLQTNGQVIVDLNDVTCTYVEDDYLEFIEDGITNRINIKENWYKRISSDYTMYLDFNKKIGKFTFPTKEECSFSFMGAITKQNTSIYLRYNFAEELKEIQIKIKGKRE